MKSLSIISLFLISSFFAKSQYNPTEGMKSEFASISKFGRRQSGNEAIQQYSSNEIKGSQFFYPSFQDGSITTTSGELIDNLYQFLFDKVRQLLFIKYKSDNRPQPEIIVAEKNEIKSFTINTDKTHFFVAASTYDPTNTTDFYEVLISDANGYTLLKSIKATFVKNDPNDIVKMRNGEMYDEFVDKLVYYVSYKKGVPQKLKEKGNNKDLFATTKKAIVVDYYNEHNFDTKNEIFLINMILQLNK